MLIVDDEPANLRMLERLFRDNYEVVTAESGAAALELLSHNEVALIISDQRMPGMTGLEFLKKAAEMRPRTARIILTGYTDVADLVEAVNSGVVYKYITKPWVNTDLCQTVRRAIEHYKSTKVQSSLAQENERLEERLKTTVRGFVSMLSEIIAQKSTKLAEHCRRTSECAALMGTHFNLEPDEMEHLISASLLHEIPNIRIPFEMDLSKAALTAEQLRVTWNNYEIGLRPMYGVPDLEEVASIISYQHESFDGTGFFDGLAGDGIPFLSRILTVANAFDEINSGRNPALFCTDEEAADWLVKRAGTKFDPQVVQACLEVKSLPLVGLRNGALSIERPRAIVTAALRPNEVSL
jgi:response regulator RpfG family c-di-GMP phosphodiesterase